MDYDIEAPIPPNSLKSLREIALGISQEQMAQLMDMPVRTYQDLEAGRSKIRGVHMWAARMAALRAYVGTEDATLPGDLLELARNVLDTHKRRSG